MNRITIEELQEKKRRGQKITVLTAYDALFARIVDHVGLDAILVGDSLGVVVQGRENTLSVTMDEMIYHTRMVGRVARHALVIGDMPFMSYQQGAGQALENAGRFLQEAGAGAVKLEGGIRITAQIEALASHGIPVLGHIGMTPQSIHQLGGYKVQGRDPEAARQIIDDARAVQEAGAFAVVLEAIPPQVAGQITRTLSIPTIGIGAGPDCDGQVLVLYDMLGLFSDFTPKFVRRYAELQALAREACRLYKKEVEDGNFPGPDETYE